MRILSILITLVLAASDANSQSTALTAYDKAYSVERGYTVVAKDGKMGLMNPSGQLVTKMEYDKIPSCDEGIVRVVRNGKYGSIGLDGKEIIPCIYDEVSSFTEGAAPVKKDGMWGIIKSDGQMLLPCVIKNKIYNFSNGYAPIMKNLFEVESQVDHTGRIIPDSLVFDVTKPLPRHVKNGMAYFDKKGNRVIPQTFAFADEFKDGLAWVRTDRTWGFINLKGEMVAERYMSGTPFGSIETTNNGFIIVNRGEKYGLINSQGKEILPCRYEWLSWDKEAGSGLLKFKQKAAENNGKEQIGYINTKGKVLLAAECDVISYDEVYKMYIAKSYGKNGDSNTVKVMNKKGKVVFHSDKYHSLAFASAPGTFIAYDEKGKKGLIDINGNILIPFEYDKIESTDREHYRMNYVIPYNKTAPLILYDRKLFYVVSAYGKPL